MKQEKLRNVAIIAHVDHGKTTLVDEMLKQGGVFRAGQEVEDRVMDSNALERERGITILAKNTSVMYNGTKINIVDTPGHADFSGEVERILKMVDGVLLLVDAFEGPMPQTRFVLQKALELNHKVIVVVNKVDKPDARPLEVVDEVLELLLDLDATEEQLESPVLFCSGRAGTASLAPDDAGSDLIPLFETIIKHIDCPEGEIDAPLQTLVSAIDYNDYVGRIGVGRVERGVIRAGQEVMVTNALTPEESYKARINTLYVIEGLNRTEVKEAEMGEIICFSGIEKISIGDTVCSPEDVTALPFVKISEPTVEMLFCVNDSPMAGREGKFVTSRQIADRLFKELLKDVSLRVERTDSTDAFKVMGRGEMHLSILIENMRREGYEFAVTPPQVLYKTIDGEKCEPMEEVLIDTPDEYVGTIIEKLSSRKGTLLNMHPQGSRTRIEFVIPVRGLFGYRNEFLTDTKGEGIMNSRFKGYEPFKGEISRRSYGSLIAFEGGTAVTYGLFNAQERGQLFIGAGVEVYEGMIIGQNPKGDDMAVNVCKKKHITNTRASGSDEALRLIPPKKMSLEQCIEFLSADELLEVTPKSLRLRKRTLSNVQRMKDNAKK
ncbi:MAG: translational GTPase TypA [Oscillospiraceae bacterium]|nr:translational GTPase TypA [Oscillospiraceae bacterium]